MKILNLPLLIQWEKFKPEAIGIESVYYQKSLAHFAREYMFEGKVPMMTIRQLKPEHGASKEANQAEIAGDLNSFLSVKGAEKVSAIGLFCTHFPFFKNEIANYFSARGIKDVVFVSQGKIFAAKIRSKIEADIDSGKIKKRAVALNIKSVPHPVVRSHITGDNLLEIKGVLSKIAPDMVDSVVFDKVTITPVAI